jgi:RecQ family ATP-dependent DNA helicase
MPESLFAAAGLELGPEGFAERARALIARIDGGEPVEGLASELGELRAAWRLFGSVDREELKAVAGELSVRTAPPGTLAGARSLATAPSRPGARSLATVEPPPGVAARRYDGPADPDALLAYFGLEQFRTGQREAIAAALAGRDASIVMPTGRGKSLCYTLPGLASDRLTVVVSPLIALMSDQYVRLRDAGHPAAMLASGMPEDHNRMALAAIRSGAARIVFCSPERFASTAFVAALQTREIGLFAVDEAHCVSEWGHDFRPDYLQLHEVIEQLGRPPVMALTATATPVVAREIAERLGLRDPLLIHSGFDRPNLSFDILHFAGAGAVARKLATLAAILQLPDSRPAIVYAGTRKQVDDVTTSLCQLGMGAVGYHAGMEPEARHEAQRRFLQDEAEIVVATTAFGMGVDKPNVRTVVHYAVPTSVESYYQEVGRAGRDGLSARAVLLAMRADLGRLIHLNQDRDQRGWSQYRAIVRFVENTEECRRTMILRHFGDSDTGHPSGRCCDVCDPVEWLPEIRVTRSHGSASGRSHGSASGRSRGSASGRSSSSGESHSSGQDAARAAMLETAASDPLFEQLKAWRVAAAEGKPAYTVLHNSTLAEIVQVRPSDPESLLAIRGISEAKLERYGEELLSLVAAATPS